MNIKHLAVLAAFVGSTAMADDISVANERFIAYKSRAEARAEVTQARASGTLLSVDESGTVAPVATPSAPSTLTREQVRAELRKAPKPQVVSFNPAA